VSDAPDFEYGPSAAHPGWFTWNLTDTTRFNAQVMGELLVRREGERLCRLRMFTERKHSNLSDNIHGAVTLSLIDIALFAAFRSLAGGDGGGAVTLELSSQFIGAGKPGEPLDALVEIMRETGRLIFLRGTVVQGAADENLIASFSGIVRKPSPGK
jgi:acyl-coenzyme A thioesterase PaaI-like protein